MLKKLRKAFDRRLSMQDVLAYSAMTVQRAWGTALGTSLLYCKARVFGVFVGKGVRACGQTILGRWPGSTIRIATGCRFISGSRRSTAEAVVAPVRLQTFGASARIELAEGVELTGTSLTARSTAIYVGKHTMFAPGCVVVDSDFHALVPAETRHIEPGLERDAPVYIGNHVWVGMHSLILKGVTIGDGSIIAAGSVVTRDIPAGVLAGGVPAVVLRVLSS